MVRVPPGAVTTMKAIWTFLTPMAPAMLTRLVRRTEDLGFAGIWFPQLAGAPFPMMTAAAMSSSRIGIGSGIALAFSRSPVETALAALEVDLLAGGRTVLGLGPGARVTNEKIHGAAYGNPGRQLREVIGIVRDVIERGHTGELGVYEGEYHRADFRGARFGGPRPRPSVPIHLAALFEGSIRLAGEIADGLLGHPIWSLHWIETELERNLRAGREKAGPARAACTVNLWSYVTIGPDRRRAIDDARTTVAFYASRAQYVRYFEAHGFGAEARTAAAAWASGDVKAALSAVPDEMVTTFSTAGTPEEVRERVERLSALADVVTLVPPGLGGLLAAERVDAYREAILDTFS